MLFVIRNALVLNMVTVYIRLNIQSFSMQVVTYYIQHKMRFNLGYRKFLMSYSHNSIEQI